MKKYFFIYLIVFFCVSQANTPKKNIYIIPFSQTDVESGVFCSAFQRALEKYGYTVKLTMDVENLDDVEYIISFNHVEDQLLHDLTKYPKEKLILYIWESPVVDPAIYRKDIHAIFSKIFTWDDDLVDNSTYFKFHFPIWRRFIVHDDVSFNRRKLCVLMANNKFSTHSKELYSERRSMIQFFENLDEDVFDFYGRDWGQGYRNYNGYVDSKFECLKYYKFCICYENMRDIKGWITEKIYDCFEAGCVPIYWGASNIEHYIPKNCFIARQAFKDDWQLYNFIKNLSEKDYLEYMDNIKKFAREPKSLLPTDLNFIENFFCAVEPRYDRHSVFTYDQIQMLEQLDSSAI